MASVDLYSFVQRHLRLAQESGTSLGSDKDC